MLWHRFLGIFIWAESKWNQDFRISAPPCTAEGTKSFSTDVRGHSFSVQTSLPWWLHRDMPPEEVSPMLLDEISYCAGTILWTLGKLLNYTLCLSRNIKILATSSSHIFNSVSYCQFCTSKPEVMELIWLYWINASSRNRRTEPHLCKSSACHWWQVLGDGLYSYPPFVKKIPCWGEKPESKVFFKWEKKSSMFLFSFVSVILSRSDFTLSARSLC